MKKFRKKMVIWMVMLSMITMYGSVPYAQAVDSLTFAKDTITDSDPLATATHTFTFTTATALASGDLLIVKLDDSESFTGILAGGVTCPTEGGTWAAAAVSGTNNSKIVCAANGAVPAGTYTVVVASVVNPVAANYRMTVSTTNAAETITYERAQPMVAIIDNIWMTARVTSTLNFTISGTTTAATVNGAACDRDTSTSSTLLDFGTLNVGASTTICQELTVETNATEGYTVTVYQDDELSSDGGDTINSFKNAADGTGLLAAEAWSTPTGLIDQYDTYGHMGLTSDDPTLTSGDDFGDELYMGFNGYGSANDIEVMYHDGPADGFTIDKGRTLVAYTVEISALQEAGDYETVLTYVATPTY